MLNSRQHKMIGKVFEMLESFTDEDFEESNFLIEVSLQDKYGDFYIVFDDEAGWTYRLVEK